MVTFKRKTDLIEYEGYTNIAPASLPDYLNEMSAPKRLVLDEFILRKLGRMICACLSE